MVIRYAGPRMCRILTMQPGELELPHLPWIEFVRTQARVLCPSAQAQESKNTSISGEGESKNKSESTSPKVRTYSKTAVFFRFSMYDLFSEFVRRVPDKPREI